MSTIPITGGTGTLGEAFVAAAAEAFRRGRATNPERAEADVGWEEWLRGRAA